MVRSEGDLRPTVSWGGRMVPQPKGSPPRYILLPRAPTHPPQTPDPRSKGMKESGGHGEDS